MNDLGMRCGLEIGAKHGETGDTSVVFHALFDCHRIPSTLKQDYNAG